MLSEPKFVTRPEQPFAAIRLTVRQPDIPNEAPQLGDDVAAWLAERDVTPTGAPFFNYTRMGETLDLEVGFPTAAVLEPEGRVVTGILPAGRYAMLRYTGPYEGLYDAHGHLHEWLAAQDLAALNFTAPEGRSTLLEIYETDPAEEPDPTRWITDIAFRLGD